VGNTVVCPVAEPVSGSLLVNILVDGLPWIVFVERCGDVSPRYGRLAEGLDKGFT
jgi:hypothetical protein